MKAGLATDKGGADGHVDNVNGRYTRSASNEARHLLEKAHFSCLKDDAALEHALENGDTLAKLKVAVDVAKKDGEITAQGFVAAPQRNHARTPKIG